MNEISIKSGFFRVTRKDNHWYVVNVHGLDADMWLDREQLREFATAALALTDLVNPEVKK